MHLVHSTILALYQNDETFHHTFAIGKKLERLKASGFLQYVCLESVSFFPNGITIHISQFKHTQINLHLHFLHFLFAGFFRLPFIKGFVSVFVLFCPVLIEPFQKWRTISCMCEGLRAFQQITPLNVLLQ